jgi:hypothetical protein
MIKVLYLLLSIIVLYFILKIISYIVFLNTHHFALKHKIYCDDYGSTRNKENNYHKSIYIDPLNNQL